MTPKNIARILQTALTNGEPALTFTELAARALMIDATAVTEDDIASMRGAGGHRLRNAQAWLEEWNICSILVTDFYFENFDGNREPQSKERARLCCALHSRPAAGIRIMSMKDSEDDILCITWIFDNATTASGMQSANLRRVAIEHAEGKLTFNRAVKMLRHALAYKMPEHHEAELDHLIKTAKIKRLERKNGGKP